MKITSRCIRLMLLLAVALVGSLTSYAESDIELKLNKHNFEGNEKIKVTAKFKDQNKFQFSKGVYADLISPEDSIVASVLMMPISDGLFEGEIQLPGNGFEKHSDILKLSKNLQIIGDNLFSNGYPSNLVVDRDYKVGGWNREGTYRAFTKIPLSTITYLAFRPRWYKIKDKWYRDLVEMELIVRTKQTYNPNNVFRLQVVGTTEDGELVGAEEPLTIHLIHYFPYFDDKEQRARDNNYLHRMAYDEEIKIIGKY